MKSARVLILSIIVSGLLPVSSFGEDILTGALVPVSPEKTSIVTGDAAYVTLGERDGVVKGDIGTVTARGGGQQDIAIGRCVVTKTSYQSSTCEVISARQEIEKGNPIAFPRLSSTEETFQPFAINVLSNILESYEPHRRLNVCVYGVFDNNNAVTGLSELLTREMETTFSQKKRIRMVDRDAISQFIFYPGAESAVIDVVKAHMKKAGIDVLILGKYRTAGDKIHLAITRLDRGGKDGSSTFSFPLLQKYLPLSAAVVLPAQEGSKADKLTCSFSIKPSGYPVRRDERGQLIKQEAAGNPFIQQTMHRIDFNLLHPVETKVTVDDEEVPLAGKEEAAATVTAGVHRIAVSFKRGYYYNESLMFTSSQEVKKVFLLDLSKRNNLVCEVRLNPVSEKDGITVVLYERAERERQVIRPIYRVDSEKTIERFKD